MSTAKTVVRAVGSLLALNMLVVGVPIVLVGLAGWPLPSAWPDWSQVWLDLRQLNIDGARVTGALAVGAWFLWAQSIWALIFEVLNMVRSGRGLAARRAPLAVPAVSALMSKLVAGVVSATLLMTPPASAGAVSAESSAIVTEPDNTTSPPADERATGTQAIIPAPSAPTSEEPTKVQVGEGETAWDVAVRVFGDGNRVGELLEHNQLSALDVHAGMTLDLPPGVSIPADELIVAEGDHLWGISSRRLTEAGVDDPSNAQIAEHVKTVVDANQPAIADPDLIHPDQVLALPALGSPPVTEADEVDEVNEVAEPSEPSRPAEAPAGEALESDDAKESSLQPPDRGNDVNPGGDHAIQGNAEGQANVDDEENAEGDSPSGAVVIGGLGLVTAAVGAIITRSQARRIGERRPGTTPRFASSGATDRPDRRNVRR